MAMTRRIADTIAAESLLEDNIDGMSTSESERLSLYDESSEGDIHSESRGRHSSSHNGGGGYGNGYGGYGYGPDGDTKRTSASITSSRETNSLWSVDSEERAVTYTKLIFLSCLALTSIALSVVVYYLVRKEELDDFRTEVCL